MTIVTDNRPDQVAQPNSSGIRVIIVGLGIAGLTAAIECHRKGHTVTALEKSAQITRLGGDGISIGANGARVIRRWANGEVHATLQNLRCTADDIHILDDGGNPLMKLELAGYTKGDGYTLNRGALVWHMYQYALSLGIDLRLGTVVDEYWESEQGAGVRTATGSRIEGDCILLAEGTHSPGRSTMGHAVQSIETGLAAFRCFIPTDTVAKDPAARWILEGTDTKDIVREWAKDDVYVAMWTLCRGKYLLIYCQYKGTDTSVNSWLGGVDSGRILDFFQTWRVRHQLEAVIRHVPPGQFFDQKLVIHRPLGSWVSRPHARMMMIGDAAHTILPISGQGGSQAIEDGATVAIALELATKSNVAQALRVAEKIRHPRASAIQTRFSIDVDPEFPGKSDAGEEDQSAPDLRWIFDHDCQRYAYDEFVPIVKAMERGGSDCPRNLAD